MRKEELLEKALEFFKENEDLFNEVLEEMDNYNGYLGDNRTYYMEDFNELLNGKEPLELASMIAFGEFNPYHDYFYFNGYGNIKSSPYIDYSDLLNIYTVDDIADFIEEDSFPYCLKGEEEIEKIFNELLENED